MSKTQKTIITIEIILLVVGLLVFFVMGNGGSKGSKNEIIKKVQALKSKLVSKKNEYKNDQKMLSLIDAKIKEVDSILNKYNSKDFKFNTEIEVRNYFNLENEINSFLDDCQNISKSINNTKHFIATVKSYFKNNAKAIKMAKTNRKVSRDVRKEIISIEKKLNQGIKELSQMIETVKTPDDAVNLSLKQLDMEQPFNQFKHSVKVANDMINEANSIQKENTTVITKITPKPPVVKKRRIKRASNPVLIKQFNPHSIPQKFWGQKLFTIIEITIGKDGSVKDTKVFKSSGNADFDNFCKNAAKQFKYKPAMGYYADDPAKKQFPIDSTSKYPFMPPQK